MKIENKESRVSIPFTISEGGLSLTDAISISLLEYELLTDEELLAIQHKRFANYVHIINNPPAPVEDSPVDGLENITE
jgi:hypothetical protein